VAGFRNDGAVAWQDLYVMAKRAQAGEKGLAGLGVLAFDVTGVFWKTG